jgi:calcineurin-like phosphoesterase family protein
LDSNKNLTKNLAELIGQPEPDEQTVSEWLASLKDQAELLVLLDYPWAKNDPDITAALAVLLKRRELLESGQDDKNDLEAAITEAQKLLEV